MATTSGLPRLVQYAVLVLKSSEYTLCTAVSFETHGLLASLEVFSSIVSKIYPLEKILTNTRTVFLICERMTGSL